MAETGTELEVELSKLSGEDLAENEALPDQDVLKEIAQELEARPNPTRVTSARPKRAPVPVEGGGALSGPVEMDGKPGGGTPGTMRRAPAKPKEDTLAAEVQLSVEGDQVFEVHNGQAQARVSDRLETRAAFLFYSNSTYRPNEMHRMTFNVPYLKADQLLHMCSDLDLVEPKGPMSNMALGIMYATNKDENEPGLSYAAFLDVLLELAFESGRNVAGQLAAGHKAREQAQAMNMGSTQRLKSMPMSETAMLQRTLRTSQSILRGSSECGFKNTSRSDQGAPTLGTGPSFRSRFSDCGKAAMDSPDALQWQLSEDGSLKPHPPPTQNGRSRAAVREARKLRPSLSGNPWRPPENEVDATTAASACNVHPLHAAAFRSGAAAVSPTATLGRSSSLLRPRFSRCGNEDGGMPQASCQEDSQDAGSCSPRTWSTDTSISSPNSICAPVRPPSRPRSRPSSGVKSPQGAGTLRRKSVMDIIPTDITQAADAVRIM